jgi:hypothetical protein
MKSRWVINILLIVAIIILALVARYQPGIEAPPEPRTLTSLRADDIQTIRINRPLRNDLLFRKKGNAWTIDREPALPAEDAQVRALLKMAGHTAVRSYPAEELDLARLALDPPYATVTLDGTAIDFGSLEPLEELRYARVGDQVHLISDMYQHLIEGDHTRFVRRRLLAAQARIVSVELPDVSLVKSAGGWEIEPPAAVSADALQQLVDNWQQASALTVRPVEDAPDDAPAVTLMLEPDRQIRFLIAAREPELVLIRPDFALQYHMGDRAGNLLEVPEAAPASAP